MRLVKTESPWGNDIRTTFFIDGKPASARNFAKAFKAAFPTPAAEAAATVTRTTDNLTTRTTWES